jgi:mono/diheme cytochrome c family protein
MVFILALPSAGQNLSDVLKKGEQVFASSCATGYCHGVKGGPGGAPRLAGRGFDQQYVNKVVNRGIPGTGMASFADRLSPLEVTAVVAYVAGLNGVTNPHITAAGPPGLASVRPSLTGEAARGEQLFKDAVRSFGRCSTCHEVGGFGIPVATPIAKVPASVAALKALATPNVKTGALDGDSMPVLILREGKQSTLFYDLTSVPPVERNADQGSVRFADGSSWRHSTVLGSYNDAELNAVLSYLQAVLQP